MALSVTHIHGMPLTAPLFTDTDLTASKHCALLLLDL